MATSTRAPQRMATGGTDSSAGAPAASAREKKSTGMRSVSGAEVSAPIRATRSSKKGIAALSTHATAITAVVSAAHSIAARRRASSRGGAAGAPTSAHARRRSARIAAQRHWLLIA